MDVTVCQKCINFLSCGLGARDYVYIPIFMHAPAGGIKEDKVVKLLRLEVSKLFVLMITIYLLSCTLSKFPAEITDVCKAARKLQEVIKT